MQLSFLLQLSLVFLGLSVMACGQEPTTTADDVSTPPATETAAPELARPQASWVSDRVEKTSARLQASPAGQLLLQSINYHGGLEAWWSNGPLYFRFNYQPRNETGVARDTYESADFWSSRTRHQIPTDAEQEFGWDGQNAWFRPESAEFPYNVRFWSLTPYYFVGMPFVFADEGVRLQQEENIEWDGQEYQTLRVTFEENVGDAPDDYYVLYLHPENHRLAAIRYVVSYPGYFPDGGHTPEKLMTYEDEQPVGDLRLATRYRTFMWEADGSTGDYVTDTEISDLKFQPELPASFFDAPEGSRQISAETF